MNIHRLIDRIEKVLREGATDPVYSDPCKTDSDSGGVLDFSEYFDGTNPLDAADDFDADSDSDGLSDFYEENFSHTLIADPDTDGDGVFDSDELIPLGDGATSWRYVGYCTSAIPSGACRSRSGRGWGYLSGQATSNAPIPPRGSGR